MTKLPFQPEEEECLTRVINKAQDFRRFLSSYINPMLSNPEELTTQRFYLRKIEGADILLAQETNFFKQELHKWAPIAPNPPPLIETSLSTRKPRPTKQQRLMSSLGIEKPEDIPQHLRTRHYNVIQRKARDFHPDASHQSHSQSPNGNPELNQKARSDRSSSIQDESRKPEITHHAALSGATTSMLPQPPMSATATHSFAFDHTQDSSLPVDPLLTSNPTLHSVHPFRLSASDVSTPQTPYFTGPAAQFQYDGHAGESTIGGDLSVAADNLQSSNMDAFFADLTNQDDEGNVNVHENASGKDDSWDADALDQKLVDAFLDVAH